MNLTEFLTARLSDDEDEASDVHESHCATTRPVWFPCDCGYPARVLREVVAGRVLLADYDKALTTLAAYENHCGEWDGTPEEWAETGLRLRQVADTLFRQVKIRNAVYSNHPDYHPAWSEADKVRSVQHP